MNKCLWCGSICEGFFCLGGGITIGSSNTDIGKFTKSYCYNDFLTWYRFFVKHSIPFTKEDIEYSKWENEIVEWYKNIPLIKL